jgi:hypothetical protein
MKQLSFRFLLLLLCCTGLFSRFIYFSRTFYGGHSSGGAVGNDPLMIRFQFPNGKIESVEISPESTLSSVASHISQLSQRSPHFFEASPLSDFVFTIKNVDYSFQELSENVSMPLSALGYKQGEWVIIKKRVKSVLSKQASVKKPFSSLQQLKDYKKSLLKYESDFNSENNPISLQLSDHLLPSMTRLSQTGGIHLLFGKIRSVKDQPPTSLLSFDYQIVGSHPLYTGDFLSTSSSSAPVSSLLSSTNFANEFMKKEILARIKEIVENCQLEILGFAVSTPIETTSFASSQGETGGIAFLQQSHWNKIMVYSSLYLANYLQRNNTIVLR